MLIKTKTEIINDKDNNPITVTTKTISERFAKFLNKIDVSYDRYAVVTKTTTLSDGTKKIERHATIVTTKENISLEDYEI